MLTEKQQKQLDNFNRYIHTDNRYDKQKHEFVYIVPVWTEKGNLSKAHTITGRFRMQFKQGSDIPDMDKKIMWLQEKGYNNLNKVISKPTLPKGYTFGNLYIRNWKKPIHKIYKDSPRWRQIT